MHVAIVGGGVAGVALALSLIERQISCTIYEKAQGLVHHGGGFALPPQAVRAMGLMAPGIDAAHKKTANKVLNKDKQDTFIEVADTFRLGDKGTADQTKIIMKLTHPGGLGGCVRTKFLQEMAHFLPEGTVCFNKQLKSISTDRPNEKARMLFEDGSEAFADLVVGCDGIGSRVRGIVNGSDAPSARAQYSGSFSYHMLIPMEKAVETLGKRLCDSAYSHVHYQSRVFSMPVNQGNTLAVNAVFQEMPWQHETGTRFDVDNQEAVSKLKNWPLHIRDCAASATTCAKWGLFDLADHPPAHYVKGRICIVGDAAHAMTPTLGTGAGTAIEDIYILAELLSDHRVKNYPNGIDIALLAYEKNRLPRGQELVRASRRAGELTTFSAEGVGSDLEKLEKEYCALFAMAHSWQPDIAVQEAKMQLGELLNGNPTSLKEARL